MHLALPISSPTAFDRPAIHHVVAGRQSFFSDKATAWPGNARSSFFEMINDRLIYIETLTDLGSNWISGGHSDSPNYSSISATGYFLGGLSEFLQEQSTLPLPELLMAPVPAGGFGIQLNLSNLSVDVTFYNNGKATFEYSIGGNYEELACSDSSDCLNALMELYREQNTYVRYS